jgi:arylsulfatase A-like enzyme
MAQDQRPVRNVVLVVFDTLRRDAVGCYGTPPEWGAISTPNLDAFAAESVMFTRAYPEALPTLCARRSIYTGLRTYPFHNGDFRHIKGDFVGIAPGWGPIPEEQSTLAEIFEAGGFRTGLVSDLYHQFKPSKNFWRGFHQWSFIRGQEADAARSGPFPSQEEIDYWVPRELQELRGKATGLEQPGYGAHWFSSRILLNMRDRVREEQWFNAQVMQESARWLEQNLDAKRLFLTVESFDPHEPWFVPEHYRRRYDDDSAGREQVISPYAEMPDLDPALVKRTRANYAGLVEMCDRWLGHLVETLRVTGLLDESLVIVTSDHGHSMWERRGYIGKRGYPSDPESYEVPLLVRYPGQRGAGTKCDAFVQHHDISATMLEAAGITPPAPIDGKSFLKTPFGARPAREHVTIGWGTAMTVIDDRWWMNCKVNGRGPFLFDSPRPAPDAPNLAEKHPDVVERLFALGKKDAGGSFPEFLLKQAESADDAPGCSPFAAIK